MMTTIKITHPISTPERILLVGEVVTVTDTLAHDYIQLGWAFETDEKPKQPKRAKKVKYE